MKWTAFLGIAAFSLFLLSGCQEGGVVTSVSGGVPATEMPTATRVFTNLAPTATEAILPDITVTETTQPQEIEQPVVEVTPAPELTTVVPSATNWMDRWPTATPTNIPTLALQPGETTILKPGPYSRVSSPFQVEARMKPGDDGNVYIDLVGEDGRTLYSRYFDYSANNSPDLFILHEISFTVNGAAETGRLSLSLKDGFGRTMSVATVELVLVSMGYDNIYQPWNTAEHYLVKSPYEDQFISGGLLEVYGVAYPFNSSPLVAELLDEQNNVIASAEVQLTVPSGGENYAAFTLQIPYSVTRTTFARLTLKQMSDDRVPGVVCLSSMRVILKP